MSLGKVTVTLVKVTDVKASDIGGKADPFVEFELDDCEKTSTCKDNNLNPEFNEVFEFTDIKEPLKQKLEVCLKDKDVGRSEKLGKAKVELSACTPGTEKDFEVVLDRHGPNDSLTTKAYIKVLVHA
eukprot:comp24424_c0_seq1/m.46694 comp24424_c0_seq1/g.46694  ORF comp24424_c0_seq1/g.46694 comp24424_c0_seq1/m.46694 type:complete len:127 (-) comp24424_c0_seq1:135-515(-)